MGSPLHTPMTFCGPEINLLASCLALPLCDISGSDTLLGFVLTKRLASDTPSFSHFAWYGHCLAVMLVRLCFSPIAWYSHRWRSTSKQAGTRRTPTLPSMTRSLQPWVWPIECLGLWASLLTFWDCDALVSGWHPSRTWTLGCCQMYGIGLGT